MSPEYNQPGTQKVVVADRIPVESVPHYGEVLLQHFPELEPYLEASPWVHDVMEPLANTYPWKVDHSIRAALLAEKVGRENMGLNFIQMKPLIEAMLTHDVGFAYLPEEIVNGKELSEAQRERMREHSKYSTQAVFSHSISAAYLVEHVHLQGRENNRYSAHVHHNYMAAPPAHDHPLVLAVYGITKLPTLFDVTDAIRADDRMHYKMPFTFDETVEEIGQLKDVYGGPLYESPAGLDLVRWTIQAWEEVDRRFKQVKQNVFPDISQEQLAQV